MLVIRKIYETTCTLIYPIHYDLAGKNNGLEGWRLILTLLASYIMNGIYGKGATKLYFILRAWSLFCSMRIYISWHFLLILFKKLVFYVSLWFFMI